MIALTNAQGTIETYSTDGQVPNPAPNKMQCRDIKV